MVKSIVLDEEHFETINSEENRSLMMAVLTTIEVESTYCVAMSKLNYVFQYIGPKSGKVYEARFLNEELVKEFNEILLKGE